MIFFTYIYILQHLIELCVLNEDSSHNSVFLTILMKMIAMKLVVLRVLGVPAGSGCAVGEVSWEGLALCLWCLGILLNSLKLLQY